MGTSEYSEEFSTPNNWLDTESGGQLSHNKILHIAQWVMSIFSIDSKVTVRDCSQFFIDRLMTCQLRYALPVLAVCALALWYYLLKPRNRQ
jgi:hypothetical protein